MSSFFPFGPLRPAAVLVTVVATLATQPARAVEPFVIRDIRDEGLQRTDPGTVVAALPFRIGDTYTDDKGTVALRALFATGLFKDVRIEIKGRVAIVIVDERAVIASVSFVGLEEFDKDTILKSLKDSGIGEGLPFDRSLVDRAEQEIKRQYLSRSLYGAEVETTITPIERNRVNVTFTVNEGEAAKIKEIRITGNRACSESTLRSLMDLTVGSWLTWYTETDRYSRAKLNGDLETIRAYYVNRGYLEFAVESTQCAARPSLRDTESRRTARRSRARSAPRTSPAAARTRRASTAPSCRPRPPSTRAPLASARYAFILSTFRGNQVIAIGGSRDGDNVWNEDSFVHEIEVYDPTMDRWETVAQLPQPAAFSAGIYLINDQNIWVTGGQTIESGDLILQATWIISPSQPRP